MESKQLNKIVLLLLLTLSIDIFSQMKMIDINRKKITINLKKEKRNIIKLSENDDYTVFYIIDRKVLDFKEELGTATLANIIFFSKKYNKGILAVFEQGVEHGKNSVYDISLDTGPISNYMFISSLIIVDQDFNYEYLMKYYYMPLPPPNSSTYTSGIKIQDNKNRCNVAEVDINGNIINENIDDILSNISKIKTNDKEKECNPLISDEDLKYFFPKKKDKDGHVYYKK